MGRNPFVVVCIDGVSGTNPIEVARTVQALMDLPSVGRHMPQHETAYEIVLPEIIRIGQYLPSLVVSPSSVALVAGKKCGFEHVHWERLYPRDRTLFVTLTEDVMAELKTEGSDFMYSLMGPRLKEQADLISVSQRLGQMGYRTKTVPFHSTQLDVAKRVVQEIRLTRRNIMEEERNRDENEE